MEKRPLEDDDDDDDGEDVEPRKKQRTSDIAPSESILDDIRIEEIESRISVHVIDTPEACTHEVAVYPGNFASIQFARSAKLNLMYFICVFRQVNPIYR